MKAQISFAEIEEIIRKKVNANVDFSYVSQDTVKVSTNYEMNLIIKKVNIPLSINVKLIKIEGGDIVLGYSLGENLDKFASLSVAGNAIDSIIDKFLPSKYKDFVTLDANNMLLTVHLGNNKKIANVIEAIEVKDVKFDESGVRGEIGIR